MEVFGSEVFILYVLKRFLVCGEEWERDREVGRSSSDRNIVFKEVGLYLCRKCFFRKRFRFG